MLSRYRQVQFVGMALAVVIAVTLLGCSSSSTKSTPTATPTTAVKAAATPTSTAPPAATGIAPGIATGTENPGSGVSVAVTLKEFSVAAVPATVKAGEVTFKVTDAGAIAHEMVVAKTDLDPKSLPKLTASSTPVEGHAAGDLDEAQLVSPGEVDDVTAATPKEGTFKLDSGKYVLFCNLPGHYAAGMYTTFTVQ
jgi:uncharacterized cupredoxin-like copper-binding protein